MPSGPGAFLFGSTRATPAHYGFFSSSLIFLKTDSPWLRFTQCNFDSLTIKHVMYVGILVRVTNCIGNNIIGTIFLLHYVCFQIPSVSFITKSVVACCEFHNEESNFIPSIIHEPSFPPLQRSYTLTRIFNSIYITALSSHKKKYNTSYNNNYKHKKNNYAILVFNLLLI